MVSMGANLGRVASGGGATLLEDGLEAAQSSGGHARPDAIILTHHNLLLITLRKDAASHQQ